MLCYFISVPTDESLILNPPEVKDRNCIFIEFHCLLSTKQWGFDDSSQVFIRFVSHFNDCFGPMERITKFVHT